MQGKKKRREAGNATLEYTLLLPVIFVCILAVILVFLVLYQKALIQNLAEDAAQSLSRQWGYKPIPVNEMETGVYQKKTYETREIYWHLKLWINNDKEAAAEKYLMEKVMGSGLLKPYKPSEASGQRKDSQSTIQGVSQHKTPQAPPDPTVVVNYTPGLPSTLTVEIQVTYKLPGLKLIGLEYVPIKGYAQAFIYDSKDMINTTDYVIQLLRGTSAYQNFAEKLSSLKKNLKKLVNK